jgi:hypothetical protein
MSDQTLIELSTANQNIEEPFVKKEVLMITDQNNGSYSGTISIDSSSLANSGRYQDWKNAYLEIPLVITLSYGGGDANVVTAFNQADAGPPVVPRSTPFAVALKNGFHQILNSYSIEWNNTSVVQLSNFSNFYTSFKLMTTLSQDDLKKMGPSLGFYPDTSTSYRRNNATDVDDATGGGVRNNSNAPKFDRPERFANLSNYNEGMYERQKSTAFEHQAPISDFVDANTLAEIAKNYYANVPASNAKVWYVMARIHLKYMHDFFDKLPLVRGGYCRMILNSNTATHTIRIRKTANARELNVSCPTTTVTGNTSPLMFADGTLLPADVGALADLAAVTVAINGTVGNVRSGAIMRQGSTSLVTALGADGVLGNNTDLDLTFRISIARDTALNLSHPTYTQCRLYIPVYLMNEIPTEQNYLSMTPTKQVIYEDIYSYQVNIDAGQNFNSLISNGIPGIRSIVCIPMIQASANNVGRAGAVSNIAPYLSPFASEPGTTSPLVCFRNFQIQISGMNMFLNNVDYDYSMFMDELQSINALNGNITPGLTSGLISEEDFIHSYRYYVCDCSRRLQSEDVLPKSVNISGINKSLLPITLHVFVVFGRKVTINVADGSIVNT